VDPASGTPDFVAPASYGQERLWLASQVAADMPLYNLLFMVDLPGSLEAGDIGRCLTQVLGRHEVLRTSLQLREEGLVQVVHQATRQPVVPPVTDLAGLDAAEQERRLAEICRAEATAPFQLDAAPLWRTRLIRLDDRWRLTFVAHHTIFDAGSHPVLRAELTELATALVDGRDVELPELDIQYADYAAWQRDQLSGPTLDEQLTYWRERLTGLPLVHALPLDRVRSTSPGQPGADLYFTLPAGTSAAAGALGRAHGASRFMVMFAAYVALLAKLSGQADLVVGVPVAGRNMPELTPLLGMFVNTLLIRIDVSGDPTFAELLSRVRERVLEAWEHQDVPVQLLVEEHASRREPGIAPLYQIGFNQLSIGGHGRSYGSARDELFLELSDDDGRLEYRTDLFDQGTAERLVQWYARTLQTVLGDPEVALSRLSLLDEAGRSLVVEEFNATAARFPADVTLTQLIADQVARTPDAIAVQFDDATISYAELDAWAARIAHRLIEQGVGPESLVGVCAERSFGLVAALFGVLKAGAGYVPLDPEYPAERLDFMTTDSGVRTVLTQTEIAASKHWPDPPVNACRPAADPGNVAYVIYTSGSTGRPKGVANTHHGVVNRLHWMQQTFPLSASDAVVQKTPFSFDVSVWEFFWPLMIGARVVMARPGGHKDPHYLRELFISAGITTAHFVPSMLAMFLGTDGPQACPALRRVICSGEELPAGLARQFLAGAPGCELHNLYGPTEAAIDVSWWPCDGGDVVPIGGPIHNIRLYVVDEHGQPVPVGMPGELFIGGVGVARGYWNRPGLTAQRFVPDPFGPPGSRLYRTGDAARWRPDGALEFLGRLDGQVKLRGLRIELGEITTALREHPGVLDATVIVREDTPGDRRLVAYLVGDVDVASLRSALKTRLPDFMIPAGYVELAAIPVTVNGKLDRAALPPPPIPQQARTAPPDSEAERLIADVWQDVLGITTLGIDDDFYDLGGHSLLAIQVVTRLRNRIDGRYPRQIGVMDLLAHRTVRKLASHLEHPDGQDASERPLLQELTRMPQGPAALSYVCIPYGGATAAVFQPLADALPAARRLYAVTLPGHDIGLDEPELPFEELAERCTAEVLERVRGPLVLYGHCGIGGALTIEVARRVEASGRRVEAIYLGAVFPFALPKGPLRMIARMGALRANRRLANWMTSMGVDLAEFDADQADRIVANMRADWEQAELYFTDLLNREVQPLRAPVISVVGTHDPETEYYQERYREWGFITATTALVVLDQAGHFFLRYRAAELAEIVTRTHPDLDRPEQAEVGADGWRLAEVNTARGVPEGRADDSHNDATRRFLLVAIGQTVTLIGSALTAWAVPLYTYLRSGSLWALATLLTFGILPWLLASPLAGAVADRFDRRKVMMASGVAALTTELTLSLLLLTDAVQVWHLYALVFGLGVAATFQRLAYQAAIPQLVPKRYLGHAMGAVQLSTGTATLVAPLIAAGLLASVGLGGILTIDVATFVVALTVLATVRFPRLLGAQRKEPLVTEIAEGFRHTWRNAGLRRVILFSATMNFLAAPAIMLVAPIVLSLGTLSQVGQVSFVQGLGVFTGGFLMLVWGGPRRYRLRGALAINLAMAISVIIVGLRPSLVMVAIGVFCYGVAVELIQALYATIIEVKVPQRFHGRVLSLNTTITWSTLPIGWIFAALATDPLERLLAPTGGLAGSVGEVIGVGAGRGIGLLYIASGLLMIAFTLGALRRRPVWRFDLDVADFLPDDLVGVRTRAAAVPREGTKV
jgi:amino acid adenylation domain-containing protein